MEIENTLVVAATPAQVWALLLDPIAMGECVPGMQSVEVISDVEYRALMQVKISFISARFKLKTVIVEQKAPHYLRCEGTGEDASVASSLKQQSEIILSELPDGKTELRMKVRVDVLGRLGTFGLNVMKTKADRLWIEFGNNLAQRLAPETVVPPGKTSDLATSSAPSAQAAGTASMPASATPHAPGAPREQDATGGTITPRGAMHAAADSPALPSMKSSLWQRLCAVFSGDGQRYIHVEVKHGDTFIKIAWPLEAGPDCARWLHGLVK